MLSGRDGGQGDLFVSVVWGRDDHRVHIVPAHDLEVIGPTHLHPCLLAGAIESRGRAIAERGQSCFRTERQSRQMVLQSDPAATDDRKSECLHVQLMLMDCLSRSEAV